ncbi:MAG: hypothetical protein BAA02_04940 [Paenibacillaceae bacterium ZCTH02-B3]|nr:MAG: hypothetical protein BAA02_04940 [Paenibacillaceae bacterium ZCTH02-B3]
MDDRFDRQLKEDLARGPLTRDGFDERLRRRIEERLDFSRRAPRRMLLSAAVYATAGMLAIAAFWTGVWRWTGTERHSADELAMPVHEQAAVSDQRYPAIPDGQALVNAEIRSAFLIGLRRDEPNPEGAGVISEYRTMLIAERDGMPQVVAEGSGILMPFGQEFWLIRALRDGKGGQRLTAAPAEMSAADGGVPEESGGEGDEPGTAPGGIIQEQLLFAGNQYVSVRQVAWEAGTESSAPRERWWVKNVTMLTAELSGSGKPSSEEPHVALFELIPGEEAGPAGEEWAIIREPGRWAVRYPEESEGTDGRRVWRALPVTLPPAVVSHDRLDLGWDEIAAMDPLAMDAYTSPAGDLAALVRSDALRVVPYRLPDAALRTLTVSLDENETVVMVQWALDRYVDSWKRQASLWLKPDRVRP